MGLELDWNLVRYGRALLGMLRWNFAAFWIVCHLMYILGEPRPLTGRGGRWPREKPLTPPRPTTQPDLNAQYANRKINTPIGLSGPPAEVPTYPNVFRRPLHWRTPYADGGGGAYMPSQTALCPKGTT